MILFWPHPQKTERFALDNHVGKLFFLTLRPFNLQDFEGSIRQVSRGELPRSGACLQGEAQTGNPCKRRKVFRRKETQDHQSSRHYYISRYGHWHNILFVSLPKYRHLGGSNHWPLTYLYTLEQDLRGKLPKDHIELTSIFVHCRWQKRSWRNTNSDHIHSSSNRTSKVLTIITSIFIFAFRCKKIMPKTVPKKPGYKRQKSEK